MDMIPDRLNFLQYIHLFNLPIWDTVYVQLDDSLGLWRTLNENNIDSDIWIQRLAYFKAEIEIRDYFEFGMLIFEAVFVDKDDSSIGTHRVPS